ncbi:helix-turn-helix domain-containing protein [Actinomadura hibisca]|uniref:helix-turn-helix domain-containing protein n=1 Tax=Actinomadura hibisca TaxID=68565 RepID=UPI000835384D|nr:helix-turn-helix domain-containing protein [Actinomadura hibisca]
MDTLELLAHPVRLRIVQAMAGGRVLTTAQLADRIPDVHKATVYRHVGLLAEGGVLEVAEEQRVRGAVERRYRLQQERASVGPDTIAAMSAADHRRAFTAAMAALLAEFTGYLEHDGVDPVTDLVGYRQHVLWLSPRERAELIGKMRDAITDHLSHPPSPDRAPHLLSPILFPLAETDEQPQ